MLENINNIICRICLMTTNELKNIFSSKLTNSNVSSKFIVNVIMECAPIHISSNDNLPPNICTKCIKSLQLVNQFRDKCIKSDKILKNRIEKNLYKKAMLKNVQEHCSSNETDIPLKEINDDIKTEDSVTLNVFSSKQSIQLTSNEETSITDITQNTTLNSEDSILVGYKNSNCSDEDSVISDNLEETEKKCATPAKKTEYKCDICDKVLANKRNLDRHQAVHTGKRPFECDVCSLRFTQKSNLFKHKLAIHLHKPYVQSRPEKRFSCYCGKKFRYNCNLNTHMRTHTGEKMYMCDCCGKKFRDRSNLKEHTKIHSGERNHKCESCDKRFNSQSTLTKHVRSVHEGQRPYKCEICNKSFFARSYLQIHMSIHTGDKPFSCSICGRKFARTSTLTLHKRLHTGEKPYKCNICGKSFTQITPLKTHLKTHTDDINKEGLWSKCI